MKIYILLDFCICIYYYLLREGGVKVFEVFDMYSRNRDFGIIFYLWFVENDLLAIIDVIVYVR